MQIPAVGRARGGGSSLHTEPNPLDDQPPPPKVVPGTSAVDPTGDAPRPPQEVFPTTVSTPSETVAVPSSVSAASKVWSQHRWALIRISSPVLLLALWQALAATGLIPQDVLPAPQLIFDAGLQLLRNGKLAEALEVSGVRVLQGLLLGGLIGVALGAAVPEAPDFAKWVDHRFNSVLAVSNTN
jgi:hypothetical protein